MKALYFDGKLELRDVDSPRPAPEEALIQVTLAGICGTDREILKGYFSFRGIPGHEFVGRVVECQEKKWLGKRVVGEINVTCGECDFCMWGLGRHCPRRTVMGIVNRDGAFAEYLVLPVANLHEVPSTLPNEAAVFVEPLAAAAEILEQTTISAGRRVAVLGDGRLGLLVAQVLRHARAKVTLIGKHADKLALGKSWGVATVGPDQAKLPGASFPYVIEATGSPEGLREALRLVEPRGIVVVKSTFREPASFDMAKLVVDEVTLIGSRCGKFPPVLELLARGHVKVLPMITQSYSLEEGLEAFAALNQPACLKILLVANPSG
jgi:alcohol dehydrogenase